MAFVAIGAPAIRSSTFNGHVVFSPSTAHFASAPITIRRSRLQTTTTPMMKGNFFWESPDANAPKSSVLGIGANIPSTLYLFLSVAFFAVGVYSVYKVCISKLSFFRFSGVVS